MLILTKPRGLAGEKNPRLCDKPKWHEIAAPTTLLAMTGEWAVCGGTNPVTMPEVRESLCIESVIPSVAKESYEIAASLALLAMTIRRCLAFRALRIVQGKLRKAMLGRARDSLIRETGALARWGGGKPS
jgi:hypothetical protein